MHYDAMLHFAKKKIPHVLVKEDSGSDDELEDVFQSFHGLQQLFCQLICIVHVVFQNFCQLPANRNTEYG